MQHYLRDTAEEKESAQAACCFFILYVAFGDGMYIVYNNWYCVYIEEKNPQIGLKMWFESLIKQVPI